MDAMIRMATFGALVLTGCVSTPDAPCKFEDLLTSDPPCSTWGGANGEARMLPGSDGLTVEIEPGLGAGCVSKPGVTKDFTDEGVQLQIDDRKLAPDTTATLFTVNGSSSDPSGSSDVGIQRAGTLIFLFSNLTEATNKTPYVAEKMKWWRLVPNADRTGIAGEYSADRTQWHRLDVMLMPPPEKVGFTFSARATSATTSAGSILFRRVAACY